MATSCLNIVAICFVILQFSSACAYLLDQDPAYCLNHCVDPRINELATFLFEKTGGKCYKALQAIGNIILNRLNHASYPDKLTDVLLTMNVTRNNIHNMTYAEAIQQEINDYKSSYYAAKTVLCSCDTDPTGGSTAFCSSTNFLCDFSEEDEIPTQCFSNYQNEIDLLSSVVFCEARSECIEGQLALAYSIVNRVNNIEYPNTIEGVIAEMYQSRTMNEYNNRNNNTLVSGYEKAKQGHTAAYVIARAVSNIALSKNQSYPTNGATEHCVNNPYSDCGVCSNINIVSRSEWGARDAKIIISNITTPVDMFFIHHTATPECTDITSCKKRVRSMQNDHMDNNGWYDIAYSFLVGEDGNVYEGRGWGLEGAHTYPYNKVSLAASVIGNYTSILPNNRALTALKNLIACGIQLCQIRPNYRLYGHRDAKNTTLCPGDQLYKEIQTWPHYSNVSLRTNKLL